MGERSYAVSAGMIQIDDEGQAEDQDGWSENECS